MMDTMLNKCGDIDYAMKYSCMVDIINWITNKKKQQKKTKKTKKKKKKKKKKKTKKKKNKVNETS